MIEAGSVAAGSAEAEEDDMVIGLIDLMHEPEITLWKDRRAWNAQRFDRDKQIEGRKLEVKQLYKFDAVEDTEIEPGDKVRDMIWVEEMRGELVRCRLCVRDFNVEKRLDIFSGTPDSFFVRVQLVRASSDRTYALLIVDISVAFMHANILENIKVKVPPDVQSKTGFWKLKKAVNGTRGASQAWTEHSAAVMQEWGGERNDYNGSIFRIGDCDVEQHGDDFVAEGPREEILIMQKNFEESFLCKYNYLVSMHPEDKKEGHFLHRKITVDEDGYHEELDKKYVEDFIKHCGVEDGRSLATPGVKTKPDETSSALNSMDHSFYRQGGGIAQYIVDRRPDISFATKEVLRKAATPTKQSLGQLTHMAKYIKGVPRVVQDFPWRDGMPSDLHISVDSDWAGEVGTRRSTGGGDAQLGGCMLKCWCNQQEVVSLSSGEAETRGIVRGMIEGLYIANMLKQQGHELNLILHTDSAAALGHTMRLGCGKRMRHLEAADLWIQQVVRSKKASICKINGKENTADLFTKYLSRDEIVRNMSKLGFRMFNERGEEMGIKKTESVVVGLDYDDEEYSSSIGERLAALVFRHTA